MNDKKIITISGVNVCCPYCGSSALNTCKHFVSLDSKSNGEKIVRFFSEE
jgi:hypothetical protein